METQSTPKIIGNVGVLDLRNASEALIANIGKVGNVGTLLYSRETAEFITRLNLGNVGATVEVAGDAKMLTGQVTITHDYFRGQTAPLNLVIMGQVLVQPDVAVEDVESGLGMLALAGQLVCPENLVGVFQAKLKTMSGQIETYLPSGELIMGRLELSETSLRALDDGSVLTVVGNLDLPQVVPDDLLAQKIARLQVTGSVSCREENAQAIRARLANKGTRIRTVPAGFEPVKGQLTLDGFTLEALPAKKIYCTEPVVVGSDVDADLLDSHLDALICDEMVICPAALRGVMGRKVDVLKTRVVFYEGELWLIQGEAELQASRFDYLEGKLTIVVMGELHVAPDVEPRALADGLAKLHFMGEVTCTKEQMGAIQSRLGINQGELRVAGEPERGEVGIGNIGYLAL